MTLLAEAGDWDLVNGTFSKIGERYGHWVDATQYTPDEQVIMLVWHSSGIIGNGGFEYLFAGEFPGDPDYHITAEAYKTAGLLRAYEAFQEAFALFPGGEVPHDSADAFSNIRPQTGLPAIGSIENFGKTDTTELGKKDWPSSFGSMWRGWATLMRPSNARLLRYRGKVRCPRHLPIFPPQAPFFPRPFWG